VPPGVVLVVQTVRLEFAPGGSVIDVGLSVQAEFKRQPLTERSTVPVNPFTACNPWVASEKSPPFTLTPGFINRCTVGRSSY